MSLIGKWRNRLAFFELDCLGRIFDITSCGRCAVTPHVEESEQYVGVALAQRAVLGVLEESYKVIERQL